MLLNQLNKLGKFYLKLPVSLQNVAVSAFGLYTRLWRYSSRFEQLLNDARERDMWDADRTRDYLNLRVQRFVRHSVATVPYYRELFQEQKIDPSDITTIEQLQLLPVLSKATVQGRISDFVSEAIPKSERVITQTSGSTGAGLAFVTTKDALREQWSIWWRHWLRHGISVDTPRAFFRCIALVPAEQHKPPFWRYDQARRELYISGNHISPKSFPSIIEELNRRRLPWLHGNPSAISWFASLMLEHDRRLDYPIRWISLSMEQALPHHIANIEKAFGIRPIQHYGLVEAVANISENPDGNLYVDEDFAATEFLMEPGTDTFQIVGTNLSNPAFPLLRYKVNDFAEITGSSDAHGRRIVKRLAGRTDDYVILPNGSRLGRLDHLFTGIVNVLEAQIYQNKTYEITIKVVKGKNFSLEDEARILTTARQRITQDMKIKLAYVSHINREPSGKFRYVVSDLFGGKL